MMRFAAAAALLGAALLLLGWPLGLPATELDDADARPLFDTIVEAFELSSEERAQIEAGEIVAKPSKREEKRELALGVAVLIEATVAEVFEASRRGDRLDVDATILAHGPIPDGKVDVSAFEGLVLPESELDGLLEEDRADDFNLSAAENEALAAVEARTQGESEAARRQAIDQEFRKLMADRVNAYRERGVAGVGGYVRGDGTEIDVAADLTHAVEALGGINAHVPRFYAVLGGKPGDAPDLVDHDLDWRLQEIRDRPTLVLSHRALASADRFGLAFTRHFYVAHDFDALQTVTGVFDHEGASLFFYGNRTYTEQVAGFGSAAAHSIGRKFLRAEVEDLFRAIKEELEGT